MSTDSARDLPIWDNLITDLVDQHLTPAGIAAVETFALTLGDLTDRELADACETHIYGSAFWSGRGRIDVPDHAKCDLCNNEARRRAHLDRFEQGDTIYTQAHAAVMRSQGHRS